MIDIKYDLLKDIAKVSRMLGKDESDFVNKALEQELNHYRDPDKHCVSTEKGEYQSNVLECNLDKNAEPIWKECYILYKRTIFGQPYFAILSDGGFMSVPAGNVRKLNCK